MPPHTLTCGPRSLTGMVYLDPALPVLVLSSWYPSLWRRTLHDSRLLQPLVRPLMTLHQLRVSGVYGCTATPTSCQWCVRLHCYTNFVSVVCTAAPTSCQWCVPLHQLRVSGVYRYTNFVSVVCTTTPTSCQCTTTPTSCQWCVPLLLKDVGFAGAETYCV